MLMWLENHLVVLGLLAIATGLGLGALLARTRWSAGRTTGAPRRLPASPVARGKGRIGAGRVTPRYHARSR